MSLTDRSGRIGRRFTATERSVTPVIGVVVMFGITVSLIVIVAPLIFSGSTVDSGPPSIEVSFLYDEGIEASQEDTFGTTGASDSGLLTIRIEDGDDVDAGQIRITGNLSGGNLVDDTDSSEYESGDTILSGDEITVWTERGDEVQIIWTSDDGEDSYIIDDITIHPTEGNLPMGAPAPDHDCEFIEDQTPGDVEIEGVIVECDLDQFDIDDLDITEGGGVIGEVEADGEININGTTYDGDVVAGADGSDGDIDLTEQSVINGDMEAKGDGDVDMDTGSTVDGDVTVAGEIDLDADSEVTGKVDAGTGEVTISGGSTVSNSIDASEDITIDDESSVEGDVTTDGAVDLSGDSVIAGDIDSSGSGELTITSSTVQGDVSGDSDVDITSSTITGSVDGDGDVDVTDSTIENHATVGGEFSCSNSTINGETCSEYEAPNYVVTIDSTNSPVEEGNTLDVTATIENTGLVEGEQTVTLDVGGGQKDSKEIELEGGSETTKTFQWSTSDGDADEYDATVSSDNESVSTGVEVAGEVPPEFQSLEVKLTKVTGGGELNKAEFDYSLDKEGTLTFEIEKDSSTEDSTSRTSSGETWEWNHDKTALAVMVRVDIDGGDCYEIRVPSDASEGTTYDILDEGEEC